MAINSASETQGTELVIADILEFNGGIPTTDQGAGYAGSGILRERPNESRIVHRHQPAAIGRQSQSSWTRHARERVREVGHPGDSRVPGHINLTVAGGRG